MCRLMELLLLLPCKLSQHKTSWLTVTINDIKIKCDFHPCRYSSAMTVNFVYCTVECLRTIIQNEKTKKTFSKMLDTLP